MRLKAFNANKKYGIGIISSKVLIILGIIVTGLISITLYQSYAAYKLNETHNFINGEVGVFSTADFKVLAVYVNGEKETKIPSKTDGKIFEKLVCTNSGTGTWDNISWTLTISNISDLTSCNIYFIDPINVLKDKILFEAGGASVVEAKGNPNFTVVPNALTSGIYATEDEYGMSYYYRGEKNSLKNNVIFAEHQWKIIRINGDGSIRLIYNGTCPNNNCPINSNGKSTGINSGTAYGWDDYNSDAKYVGYMFGGADGAASTSIPQAQTNQTSIATKTRVDIWYESYIKSTKYEQLIADTIFCNDRSITSGAGYGNRTPDTIYKPYTRLYASSLNPVPTLKCEQQNDRFTVSDTIKGNGALTYPIGLITADEIQYAGLGWSAYNADQYLVTGERYYTMSPYSYSRSAEIAYVWVVNENGRISKNDYNGQLIRVVLNLDSRAYITSGDGSTGNPYKIADL